MAAVRRSTRLLNPINRFLQLGSPRGFLSRLCQFHSSAERRDSNRISIVRCGRSTHVRIYPVLLVQPDGSTISIQYKEPRRLLLIPVDIYTMSEEERRARLRKREQSRRGPSKKEEEIMEDFNMEEYRKFWKKK
uniref:39S ribosomal protein L55, mitochondrial n=1 Tax=Leptobrachium leishanense TaxID=445787 RepID=A0A8C5WL94_9ANUR